MTKKGRFLLWFIPAALVFVAGFVLAAFFDLELNQYLYDPANLFAIVMEAIGWYPAFLPALLLAALWMSQPGHQPLWRRLVCGVVLAVGLFAVYSMTAGYLQNRGLPDSVLASGLWLMAGLLFAAALVIFAVRLRGAVREKLTFFALFGSIFMLANQVVVYPVKILWARMRFDTMMLEAEGVLEQFTSWYRPMGHGGSSFPSGHTANAAGILVLLVLCDLFPRWNRHRKLVTCLCWGYIVLMAAARIVIGRHYLSDTLAAAALMALLFYLLHNNRWYRAGLKRALANAAAMPGEKKREKPDLTGQDAQMPGKDGMENANSVLEPAAGSTDSEANV